MTKTVKIHAALYFGKNIFGTFPLNAVEEGDDKCKREVYLKIIREGKMIKVHANRHDYEIVLGTNKDISPISFDDPQLNEMNIKIWKRFQIMEKLTEFAIAGHLKSLILSGAAGIGKSYNLEKRLNTAIDNGEITKFTILKGKISPIALYVQLYQHRDEGDILVLDDIDIIFQDEVSLNLLKAALDSGDIRRLSWLSATEWLSDQDIPNDFEFNGVCFFITNLDFDRMIERGTVLAPHFKAFISRSTYLDLGIHTNHEVMMRIRQVIASTPMLDVHGIDDEQKTIMMSWLESRCNDMRELSLRTILKIAAFMNGDPTGWQDIAEATMLKNVGYTIMSQE